MKLHWLGSKGRTEYTIGEDVEPCDRNGKAVKEIPTDWVPPLASTLVTAAGYCQLVAL